MDYAKLKHEMESDEGRMLTAYRDSKGFWTIGVGHLLGSSPRMSSITDDECDALYQWDIGWAEQLARTVVPQFDELADVRQRALVNMAFNRGDHLVHSTTILPAIKKAAASKLESDWTLLPGIIAASPWAKQVGARAVRLGRMLSTGTDT